TCGRVASGSSRVWSITPASACQELRALAANAAESNVPLSNSRSACSMGIGTVMVIAPGLRNAALHSRLAAHTPGDEYSASRTLGPNVWMLNFGSGLQLTAPARLSLSSYSESPGGMTQISGRFR